MSVPPAIDPGPVPDHDADEPAHSTAERLAALRRRAQDAQDLAGWADVSNPGGVAQLASATVQLGRVVGELVRELEAGRG